MVEPLQRWEYHIEGEMLPAVERLNQLGSEGWELVGFDDDEDGVSVFRRPAQSFVERVTLEQRARYYQSIGRDPETGR